LCNQGIAADCGGSDSRGLYSGLKEGSAIQHGISLSRV
jgi:hypothetical protein